MPRFFYSLLVVLCVFFGLIDVAASDDLLSIAKILERPSDYQAKVVTVEGNARKVGSIPIHRGAHRCAGRAVYDTQTFTLQDESGVIRVGTAGTCQPNATNPILENEHIRVRGVVVADEKDPKGIPVIYADAIDRLTP
jgi:hypothetical protein